MDAASEDSSHGSSGGEGEEVEVIDMDSGTEEEEDASSDEGEDDAGDGDGDGDSAESESSSAEQEVVEVSRVESSRADSRRSGGNGAAVSNSCVLEPTSWRLFMRQAVGQISTHLYNSFRLLAYACMCISLRRKWQIRFGVAPCVRILRTVLGLKHASLRGGAWRQF